MGLLDTLKGLFSKGASAVDANGDGQINAADLSTAAQNIGNIAQDAPAALGNIADANGDGQITTADVPAAAQNIQETVTGAADVNGDGQVNPADAQAAIDNAKNQLPQ